MKKFIAVVLVLVLAFSLVGCGYSQDDLDAARDEAYDRGYDDAIQYFKKHMPPEVLSEHYLDLIVDTMFIDLYDTEPGNILETLDNYFVYGIGDKEDAAVAYFGLSVRCQQLMSEMADCITAVD